MSEIKLLPCPFCGGEARLDNSVANAVSVECTVCHASSPIFLRMGDREQKAIESWNTRKPMERIIERLNGKKKTLCGRYNHKTPLLEMPSCKIAFNNGICESIQVIKEEGGIE